MKTSIIYIDGLNLYYGAMRGTRWKWLDLQTYFERLRPNDEIEAIKYFTAPVMGNDARERQKAYLLALGTLPKVEIVLGRFQRKDVNCRVRGCNHSGNRGFTKYEEKRTDVNVALQMLYDGLHSVADNIILVSGDSDLAPAVNAVRRHAVGKKVWVYIPSSNQPSAACVELRAAANENRTLPHNLFKTCQFPTRLPDGSGGVIEKPSDW